ncbi:hypothetical protein F5Y06DRAFT_255224 [Hypoxylon sp. FL0890]|nr:hypothetical protein F5Y06DRAFT_255224 [Hypoxylon sp. FL0890]
MQPPSPNNKPTLRSNQPTLYRRIVTMLTKRPREMDSTEMEMKTRRKRTYHRTKCSKIISPEVGSLYDILHDHATISLYVPPLCWTDLHTQVLGCRFVPRPPQNTPTPTPFTSSTLQASSQPQSPKMVFQGTWPDTVVSISRSLDTIMDPNTSRPMRTKRIKSLMKQLFPGHLNETTPELTIRCGRNRYLDAVRCHGMWKKPMALQSFASATTRSSGSLGESSTTKDMISQLSLNKPVLAYLDRRHLNYVRRSCFRIPPYPDGSINIPVHRLQELRSRKLIPKNPDEDHFILAIMIAMAQQHVYGSVYYGTNFAPKDVQVRVLTVSDEDHSFIVYTSVIPAAFLAMFQELDKAPPGNAKITIQYQRVPVWPVLGLKERLGQALGRDLVGEMDTSRIETYLDELLNPSQNDSNISERGVGAGLSQSTQGDDSMPTVPQTTPPKRKREILSEVLNVSFSEDREPPGYPSELLAKRQCLEEGNNEGPAVSSSPPGAS